jgi:thiol-disulfide isomerase/thioredoxin
VRSASDLETLLQASVSSRTTLVTFWSASWCPTCRAVLPVVEESVEEYDPSGSGSGGSSSSSSDSRLSFSETYSGTERKGRVAFVEIEYDAPGNEELGQRYMITSLPTTMAFNERGEARRETRLTDAREMRDRGFMRAWIEGEVKAGGGLGGGGGGFLGGMFGFGKGQ